VRNYPGWLRLWDAAYRRLTPVPWPARIAERLSAPAEIACDHYEISVASTLAGRTGLRLVLASDFHAGPSTRPSVLERSIEALAAARPDVLLLGGDFVSFRPDDGRDLVRRLGRIDAPLGRFAVLGNHDYHSGGAAVATMLADAGVTLLTNRSVRLPAPWSDVTLTGVDDHTSGEPDAAAAFAGDAAVRVVLMHGPSSLLDIGDRPFAVALCGHTHGGQIALPGGRPLMVAHGPLSRVYSAGRYDLGDGRTLIVSLGIGCTWVPLRLNAPPSITVCTLRPGG
jgi:predicted MPP superfamily phosphohydrolase